MKKTYVAPTIERLAFCYRDQVVAASGGIAPQSEEDFIPGKDTCWHNLFEFLDKFFG